MATTSPISDPAARARRGLGRTFQRVELFNSLTVRENIQLGREAILAGANPLTQLVGSPSDEATDPAAAEQADRPHWRGAHLWSKRWASIRPASGVWSSWPGYWQGRST